MITYLPTKLHRPALPARLVTRPNLVAQLSGGLVRGHKLSLVVAPAGFGKTTLVNEWLDALSLMPTPNTRGEGGGFDQTGATQAQQNFNPQCVWLSLDETDNDLAHFFQYIVLAIQNVFSTTGADSLRLLQAPQLPPIAYFVRTLLHEWSALPGECMLVLEDYHAITDIAIHQFVAQLLEHLPDRIHLVLISRTEPPLPLARLRVQEQLTEIRAADLCFSQAETQTFLAQALGRTLTSETITTLQNQTEGWVVGLQLAALALTGATRATPFTPDEELTFARTFAGNNRQIMAYLGKEVLAQQTEMVQKFLLRTALLDHFCAPLAEALLADMVEDQGQNGAEQRRTPPQDFRDTPGTTAQGILAYLVQANLFIVPMQGEWYRYHQLFRDLLRQHLRIQSSAAELAALYRRATAWLTQHGWIEEAIQLALAGGDERTAARLVTSRRHELLNREDWRTLERWLALLPETLVQQQAELLICKVWIFSFQFKLAAIPPLLQTIPLRLNDPTLTEADVQLLQVEINLHWNQFRSWRNEDQHSVATAQQVFEQIPPTYLYARSAALFHLGMAAQLTGQAALGIQLLRAVLETEQVYPNVLVARTLFGVAYIAYFAGDLPLVHQTAQTLLHVSTQSNSAISLGWAYYLLGLVAYEWNELETATRHFTALVDQRYISHGLAIQNGWLRLIWLEQMQGRPDQAQPRLNALVDFLHEQGNRAILPLVHSFQARLALQQGNLTAAQQWSETVTLDAQQEILVHTELPRLTHAKILLAQGTPDSLAQALVNVARLCKVAEFTHNTIRLIEILAVQALVEAAQGQTELALTTLQRAVLLAKPGRCIRIFVDLGPAMAALLYELSKRASETTYLGQMLAAFPPSMAITGPAQQVRRAAEAQLIEPLTARESEILLYLQEELSNKAIAAKLNLSALTIKKHTISLYQKLGVQSRQQAVARARALGILLQSLVLIVQGILVVWLEVFTC